MIHYFNPGEKILSLRILITPNHALTWKNSPLLLTPPLLKAVYLAPRQRSHQGRALERLGPPSFSFFLFLSPLRLQSHLEEDLEAPFVVFPWNKTNRIQVFWLALASRSRHVCLPSCEPEVVTSEESPDAPISALKWDRQVLRGCLLTFFPHPTLLQNTESVKNLMPLSLLLCGARSDGLLIISS